MYEGIDKLNVNLNIKRIHATLITYLWLVGTTRGHMGHGMRALNTHICERT